MKSPGRLPMDEKHQTLQLEECHRQKGEHRSEQSVLEVDATGSRGTLGAAGALAGGVGMKREILHPEL